MCIPKSVLLPITGRKLRLALVGCGRIARRSHIESLQRHEACAKWVAVCDHQANRAAAAARQTGGPAFTSLDALLSAPEVQPDIVVLATPGGLQPYQSIRCAQVGFHVLAEKPMVTKLDEGMAMVRACGDTGVKLCVVKQNRLNPTLKRALAQGHSASWRWSTSTCTGPGPQTITKKPVGAAAGTLTEGRS